MNVRKHVCRIVWLGLLVMAVCAFSACSFPGRDEQIENHRETLDVSMTRLADTVRAGEQDNLPVKTLVPESSKTIPLLVDSRIETSTVLQAGSADDFVWLAGGGGMLLVLQDGLAAYDMTAGEDAPSNIYPNLEALAIERPSLLSGARNTDTLAWVEQEHFVSVWEYSEGEHKLVDETETPVTGLAVSDQGNGLAYSTYDGNVMVRGIASSGTLQVWQAPSWLTNMTYSSDGRMLAGIDLSNFTAYIFNVESGEIRRTLQWNESASPALYGAYFSPNWQFLAWVARGTVQIMDIASGELGVLLGHEDFVSATAWAPDERLLATAAAGTVNGELVPLVYIWDIPSGQSIYTLILDSAVQSMAFSPDGRQLAVLDSTGLLQTWILE